MLRRLAFPRFGHSVGRQAGEAGADVQLFQGFVSGPGADLFEPGLEVTCLHLAPIDRFGSDGLQADIPQLGSPLLPGCLEGNQRGAAFLQAGADQFGWLAGFVGGPLAAEQRTHPWHQRRGATPIIAHPVERIVVHWVAEQSPVVAQHFAQQVAMVGFQGLCEQAAAVERMFAQHALAPTVDRGDCGFIHPLRGDVQAIGTGGPLLRIILLAQIGNQRIRLFDFVTEEARGFGQADADTFTQFLGSGVGERHHEDLRWQQFAAETGFITAVAEHQTQVQGGDGEGLSGASTGFNQLAAFERKRQGQGFADHASASVLESDRQGALISGRYRVSHQPSNSSLATRAA
ncbi:hypothetical protein PFLmoz3_02291 [Pseudomonas fluorescens]|uniref:Uncharacterized protein n=1 Tax=Pseudomonas fluorescens TaxID=294 RepID=A0A120G805_PSEFL|nr:hypothetical protein PFLmoz3_02291 [Pseudomonas fluorescens]